MNADKTKTAGRPHGSWSYCERVESTPSQSAQFDLCGASIDEFWHDAGADSVGLEKAEFERILVAIGTKYNFGLPSEARPTPAQMTDFWRGLQLADVALAHACALGRDVAWQRFLAQYREPLTQAAIAITGSAAAGQELADSLYSEIFGLTERDGQRQSPLAFYSGRGSLKGFLRATLAQRNVDRHRRTRRETELPEHDLPAAPSTPSPSQEILAQLGESLRATLSALPPEERFLLSAWFLDRRTLLEISRLLGVHEATISRRIKRVTEDLHKTLLRNLQASGMSRRAAEEAFGTDPRDIDINLRSLLQVSQSDAFSTQGRAASTEKP
jgi:RNA polymerase sigma-70 factor (ECF subfamily)